MICLIFRCIFWKTGALFASRVGGASTGQLPMTSRGQSTKWNCFSPLTSSPTLHRADHKVAKQLAPPSPNSKFQHWFQLLQQPNPGIPNPWPSQSKRLSGMWQNPFPIQFLDLHTRWSSGRPPFPPNSWAKTSSSTRWNPSCAFEENYSTKFRENGTQKQTWKLDHLIVPTKLRYTGHG